MINFAWSNPITGVREQTRKIAERSGPEFDRLYQEARHSVWHSLQRAQSDYSSPIWMQMEVGWVDGEGDHVDLDAAALAEQIWPDHQFVHVDPDTGIRKFSKAWPSNCFTSGGFATSIKVYATVTHGIVNRSDPEPEMPADSQILARPELSDLRERIAGICSDLGDDALLCSKGTALALLDIAESLRQKAPKRKPGLWERLKLWFSGEPLVYSPPPIQDFLDPSLLADLPLLDICSCTGDGIRPNGEFCSCETGRSRAQAVYQREGTVNRESPEASPSESGHN
jgi:hypothetical protein